MAGRQDPDPRPHRPRPLLRQEPELGQAGGDDPEGARSPPTPKSAEAHFVLGELYASQGLRSRAASALRRALELQPDHQEAASALAALGPEEPPQEPEDDGGFLKKLFGKR